MNWRSVVLTALGATLGTVGAHSYFSGFNLTLTLIVALTAFMGATFLGFVSTLGKRK